MHKRTLDFLIIGAQKSGTTSLFKYMNSHPQIFMPAAKECPYFGDEEAISLGWDSYLEEYFHNAPADKLWGTATPEYMVDPQVPKQIHDLLPDVKLIALLRDPIERAISQYRMSIRRGYESRSWDVAIRNQLQPNALEEARRRPDHKNSYVTNGEYERILQAYYDHFPTQQIAIYFTDTLGGNPSEVIRRIFDFLAIDSSYIPPDLGIVYHRGGIRRKWPWLESIRQNLKSNSQILRVWRRLPRILTATFSYWLEQHNVVAETGQMEISPEIRSLLSSHYQIGMDRLEGMIGEAIPWRNSWAR